MALSQQDEALLKRIYQNIEDNGPRPDDDFYKRFYVPLYQNAEGEDPVASLRTHIEWATVESVQMFSGFRGTGKTTELFRLKRELEGKGYLVLYADALKYLSPADEVDVATVLMSVAGAFGEALNEAAGRPLLAESLWAKVTNLLKNSTFEVTEVATKMEGDLVGALKGGIDVKAAIRTAQSFRQRLQSFLADRLSELKAEVNAFAEEGVKAIRKDRGQPDLPVVLLFDQFEQIRGSRANEQAVIHSVERLFAHHFELLKLPLVHVVYTVPPWLRFVRSGPFSITTLPCVRLWANDGERTPCPAGCDRLLQVIRKRVSDGAFERVFGADSEAGERLAKRLVTQSGGHLRDLLRLLREMTVLISTWRPALPVTDEVVHRAIQNLRNEFLPVAVEDARWLAEIARRRDTALPDSTAESIDRLSRFLDSHLVLYLTNGKDWYDVHPLVRDEALKLAKEPPMPKASNGSNAG